MHRTCSVLVTEVLYPVDASRRSLSDCQARFGNPSRLASERGTGRGPYFYLFSCFGTPKNIGAGTGREGTGTIDTESVGGTARIKIDGCHSADREGKQPEASDRFQPRSSAPNSARPLKLKSPETPLLLKKCSGKTQHPTPYKSTA